jgi:hypothetical protein
MNGTPVDQQLRESTAKWDYMKLKSFCTVKETVTRLRRKWKKIFANYTPDTGLITRIYRELKKLTSQRINIPLNKWANELNNSQKKKY